MLKRNTQLWLVNQFWQTTVKEEKKGRHINLLPKPILMELTELLLVIEVKSS